MKKAIIGFGGCAKDLKVHMLKKYKKIYIVSDILEKTNNNILYIKDLNLKKFKFYIAVADFEIRKNIFKSYPNLDYPVYIHDKKTILDRKTIYLGKGCIISKGCILTTNIKLGIFCFININCTITHDIIIGDYFTCSPGVNISGNCKIGNNVFIGTNSCIRENIKICDNVIIGMGSVVIKDILKPGTYVGNPAKKIN